MRYMKPHFYDSFSCLAHQCPDTCCGGWQIMIDEQALKTYMHQDGPFGNRLKNSINWESGAFLQYEGKCCMLNDEQLCDIHCELGSAALCRTCALYPRHVEEYEGLRELSLSLSCPEAARMMLECSQKVQFIVTETEETEDFEDFDYFLFTQLEDARACIFELVQNRTLDLRCRLSMALELSASVQRCVDSAHVYAIEAEVSAFMSRPKKTACCNLLKEAGRFKRMRENFKVFSRLERLRSSFNSLLEDTYKLLYAPGEQSYMAICEAFDACCGYGSRYCDRWSQAGEQLAVFFIYTYFCGAVYDDAVYTKMALAVFSVEWIQEFTMMMWIKNDKKRCFGDIVTIAYRYAREIEHSDNNLNILESWLENYRYM